MLRSYQSVTTDIVIFTIEQEELKVLLIKRAKEPFKNKWALPGGFILENEEPEKAALRVLKNKAGVSNIYMEQLYTFPGSGRDPRGNVITITYFALAPTEKIKIQKSKETQTPTFYSLKKLPQLAFDHKKIITYALKRLRSKLEYTNVVYSLLPQFFTFNQLQEAYETILDRELDKRNFRKKFILLNLIRSTKKVHKGIRQRPAQLYQFISCRPTELKKFF
ncbi:MAG: hypothetical protein A3B86_03560 [Candidatus Yanofskybacteria bacterium RIFCSPHIGHO2_02_FULL_38_22b]|uniref:Nudix hydrolase domain-containing protein n=1 Tax=Candidatus Yanofskybacteria bacterium RIFCSPHIGHO2_02_FULL_38_22b TaxID=1802673 RepID=A0A1F8F035_9BACT|nr:MAG: hypothetical protein A3B86_03560 [Candidatus Yanofskybacteria bacterium RIFCSPHIGHO2_02_FULL_38_22b]OGN19462.1 MAG: hypothetical protein A2910_02940 [Candidatus Yanofskybacteria bacterium RIFCSPLOWO2_01_FULL_39_28]